MYDVLRRYLEWSGLDVRLVSNITDIDDKIINRAQREDRPVAGDHRRSARRVWFDGDGGHQRAPRPTDVPHATEYVDEMVEMIGQLVEIGRAYLTDDGVYLASRSVEDYGLLAHQSLDDMLAGGGEREVFGADHKRHPADFVLWKLAKPGEPSWPSPWGEGRPGWHSECVVMSLDLLGEGFDLHCGGQDLRFPHHENERAQAVALGKRVRQPLDAQRLRRRRRGREDVEEPRQRRQPARPASSSYDPRAYRMLLLQSHYRSPVAGRPATARRGGQRARRPRRVRRRGPPASTAADAGRRRARRVPRARWTTTSTRPKATALLFDTVRRANAALDAGDAAAAALLAAALARSAAPSGSSLRRPADVPADVAEHGGRARRGPRGEGLRPCRRDPRRAAGRRLDRRDDQSRYDDSPVTDTLAPSTRPPLVRPGVRPRPRVCRGWATSRRSTGSAPCPSGSCCSTTPGSRGCTAGSSASRCSSSCPGS